MDSIRQITRSQMNMTRGERTPQSAQGEAHYRDLMLQMQGEFTRVVATLEARATSLVQHNKLLETEVQELRTELLHADTTRQESEKAHTQALDQANEQQQMLREESDAQLQRAAENECEWRATCEQLTMTLEQERKQWDMERDMFKTELQRVGKQLHEATAQLAEEQRNNAHMSQELQLLQCRVDTAVKTSRSFEQRLQQLKQLKRDEKSDLDTHVAHLQKRLEDKKEQNRYLAEALMEKETRKDQRQRVRDEEYRASESSSSSVSSSVTEPRDRSRRRDHSVAVPSPALKDVVTKRRQHEYRLDLEDKRVANPSLTRSAMEELHSHAPTSPTSSSSPPSTPSTTMRVPTPRERRSSRHDAKSSTPLLVPPPSSSTHNSERLQRELHGLRRKLEACMQDATLPSGAQ